MMKYLLSFFTFGFFLYFTTLCSAEDETAPAVQLKQPPFTFTTQHIDEARKQAKRAGWSETTIQAQLQQKLGNNFVRPLRLHTINAVLIGNKEAIDLALIDISKALSKDPVSQTPHDWFQTLLSYDCLTALPEVTLSSYPDKNETDQKLSVYSTALAKILPESFSLQDQALHQGACFYAGLLSRNEEQVQRWLNGDKSIQPLWKMLSKAVSNEGFVRQDYAYIGYLYTVLSALKTYSKDDYLSIKPWIERYVDFFCRTILSINNQKNPGAPIFDDPYAYWFLSALERSAHQFNHSPSKLILQQIYEKYPRRADMLLFGKVQWDSSSLPQVRYDSTVYPRIGVASLHDQENIPLHFFMNLGIDDNGASLLSLHETLNSSNKPFGNLNSNTVLIDHQWKTWRQEDSSKNAVITSFVPFDEGGTFLSASASGKYGERANYPKKYPGIQTQVSHYQRDVYVYAPYVIDWFRVTGGKTQDYITLFSENVHAMHGFEDEEHILSILDNASLSEYDIFQDSSSIFMTKAKGVYAWDAVLNSNQNYIERLIFIDPEGSTQFRATKEKQSVIINRREYNEPTSNLFTAIREYRSQNEKSDINIKPLELAPQPNANGFQAMAFVIKNGTQENIFYSSIHPDQLFTASYKGHDISWKCKFAHIQFINGKFNMMRLVGGTHLQIGDHQLQTDAAITTGVIHNLDEKNGTFGVTLPHGIPIGDLLNNHILQVISTDPEAPLMQSLSISEVDIEEGQPRYHLTHRINLSDPPKQLASAVQNGDQVLYESFSELKWIDADVFLVTLSSPATVSVPAFENKRRFYISEQTKKRLQGELRDGAIHVKLSPENSENGRIEVKRVP